MSIHTIRIVGTIERRAGNVGPHPGLDMLRELFVSEN